MMTKKVKWYTLNHVMPLGKYRSRPVQWLAHHDPQYLKWAHDNGVVLFCDDVWQLAGLAPEPDRPRRRGPGTGIYSLKSGGNDE